MKKFLKLIYFSCIFLIPLQVWAAEDVVVEPDSVKISRSIKELVEMYQRFDKEYPAEKIDEEFTERVAELYPNLSDADVLSREESIRNAVKLYRIGMEFYNKYKEKILSPEAPPLLLDDKDYDTLYTKDYIESGDEAVVIQDFKKVLSYGNDKKDFAAMIAKHQRDNLKNSPDGTFEALSQMLNQLEFSKMFLYDDIYGNPFTGKLGAGAWTPYDKFSARFLSNQTKLSSDADLKFALHIDVAKGNILLSQKNNDNLAPEFDFSASKNVQNVEVLRPIPYRFLRKSQEQDWVGYFSDFAMPLKFDVVDVNAPILLDAKVRFTVCNQENCERKEINPKFEFEAGKPRNSAFSNFVNLSFANLPLKKNSSFKLVEASVLDKDTLKFVFQTKKSADGFEFFINSPDGILFKRPQTSISDNKIVVKINSLKEDVDLEGKEFEVTARLDNLNKIRTNIKAEAYSVFDVDIGKLSLGLILLGVLGGFILNFMPCVFPVLSLKLLSFTKFGGLKEQKIRKGFLFSILGIFTAFVFLASMLIFLKYLGYSIGWGIQFQSVIFLNVMIFVIALFISQICDFFRTPQFVENILYKKNYSENLLNFLTGLFLVLLATPCTAPYLGTALGFALAGDYVDIVVMMFSVGFGLSLPYVVIFLFPQIALFVPPIGKWSSNLQRLMMFMLLLTLLWLLSVLYVQTNFWLAIRVGVYVVLLMGALWFYKLLKLGLEQENASQDIKIKVHNRFKMITFIVCLVLFIGAVFDSKYQYNRKQEINAVVKTFNLDDKLIQELVRAGNSVLIEVGADWCLTCKLNELVVFASPSTKDFMEHNKVITIKVDWTGYNQEVLDFMGKYGRKGLPFYIIFSSRVPNGMILPEVLSDRQFKDIILSVN